MLYDLSLVEQCHRRGLQALTWLRDSGIKAPAIELRLRALESLGSYYNPGPTAETTGKLETLAVLAEEVEDREYLAIALWGLWSISLFHNAPHRALAYADRFKAISGGLPDEARDLLYLRMSAMALHMEGQHAEARLRLQRVSDSFDPSVHAWNHLGYQVDHGLMARLYLARILWVQGHANRALRDIRDGMNALMQQSHAIALCHALCEISIPVYVLNEEAGAAKADLALLRLLADKHGLTIFQAAARCIELAFALRDGADEFAAFRSSLETLRAGRYEVPIPWLSGFLGEIALREGNIAAGISCVESCMKTDDASCPALWRPELMRVRALLIAAGGTPSHAAAAALHLREALSLARQQGALIFELRIMLTRIHLAGETWPATELLGELRELLSCFIEAPETADVMMAHRLLSDDRS